MTGLRELVAALAIGAPFLVGASVSPDRDGDVVFRFHDPRIVESSGLVVADGLVVTVNDSGHEPAIYTVNLKNGRTVGTTSWSADGHDLEALAPAGPGEVWAGDIGDNLKIRPDLEVTKVPYGVDDRSAPGESYRLTFPDQANDAEALLAHPRTGRLYVVSKHVLGGAVYAAPAHLEASQRNRMTRLGDAPAVVTDGAFFPDGRHLILRNYATATVLAFPSLRELGTFGLPAQQQGEGLAVSPDGRIYLSSEGSRSALLEVTLPEEIAEQVGSAGRSPSGDSETPVPEGGSDEPGTASGSEADDPDAWPWLLGSALGVAAIVVLVRSLRPH